jgi:hypothetical protein
MQGEFIPERYLDFLIEEEKINAAYSDIFENRLRPIIKDMKKKHYDCGVTCIGEEKIDEGCLDDCEVIYEKFLSALQKPLFNRLAQFPKCVETCRSKGLDPDSHMKCYQGCIDTTAKMLYKLDVSKLYQDFINSARYNP